jgi:DNA-binding CsgD family transcriptional regulator
LEIAMKWAELPETIRHIAVSELTPAQLDAWHLTLEGHGSRGVALRLGISRASVLDRLDNAYRKLRAAGVEQDGSGNWYLKQEHVA